MKSSLSHTLSYFLPHSHSLSYLYNHNINLPLSLPCSIPSSKTASLHFYSGYTTHHCLRSPYSVSLPLPVSISLPPHPLRFIQPETVFPLYSLFLSSLLETFATRIVPLSGNPHRRYSRNSLSLYSAFLAFPASLVSLSQAREHALFLGLDFFPFFSFLVSASGLG